jgi:hypothetical protein
MYNEEELRKLCKLNVLRMMEEFQVDYFEDFSNWLSSIIKFELDSNRNCVIDDANIGIHFCSIENRAIIKRGKNHSLLEHIQYANRGIRLIHIWDNEWNQKQDIVKSRISSFLGINTRIFARKCSIITLSSKEYATFFNTNHIQGSVSASICYGLIYNDEIVAAISFGRSRFDKKIEYELIRYSNKLNTNVVGGASKLFQHFIRQHSPNSIISYSDRRWNTGNLYQQLGFTYAHSTNPNYFYFKKNNSTKLFSRQTFQKHKLRDKLESFDPLSTEWQNMVNNGYDRIWDCGNSVWYWNAT